MLLCKLLVSASTIFIEVEIIQIDCAGSPSGSSYDISESILLEPSWEQFSPVIINRQGVTLLSLLPAEKISRYCFISAKLASHAGDTGGLEASHHHRERKRERLVVSDCQSETTEQNELLHSLNRRLVNKHLPVKLCHCYAWPGLSNPQTHIEFN